jgi:hypothetical protein
MANVPPPGNGVQDFGYTAGLGAQLPLLCSNNGDGTGTLVASVASGGSISATQGTTPWVDNVTQFGGSNISTGTGVSGAGIPRVTVSSDSFPATQAVSGTVTANAGTGTLSTNIAQWDGTALGTPTAFGSTPGAVIAGSVNSSAFVGTVAAVAAASGVQKVGISGATAVTLDAATGAAVPANGLLSCARAATANPSDATGGNLTAVMSDKAGRLAVTPYHVRDLVGIQQTAVSATSATTIITAGSSGVFNDLVSLTITTAGAAAQTITISDGTNNRFILNYPNAALAPGAPCHLTFPAAIPQSASATAWTVTQSASTACEYTAVFIKNT